MRDVHPIDQYFREALHGAEATPPTGVLEAVVRERRRRRGGLYWSLRRISLAAAIIVAFAGGVYWAVSLHEAGQRATGTVAVTPKGAAPDQPTTHATPTPAGPMAPLQNKEVASTPSSIKSASDHSPPAHSKKFEARPPNGTARRIPAGEDMANASDEFIAEPGETAGIVKPHEETGNSFSSLDDALVHRALPRHSALNAAPLSLIAMGGRSVPPYVLAKGDTWVALRAGWYSVHREWDDGSARLRDALNTSEAWTSTMAVGVLVGRTWRSGFGVSTGVEHERSEQAFRYVDRWTRVDQEITTNIVTLNTVVFASTADTVSTLIFGERVSEGLDRRRVVRVPLEGHWHRSWHRWNYGLGVGLAGEFTSVSSSSILVEDGAEGHVVSARPPGDELHSRYPAALMGTFAVDLGYLVSERWTLWAGPVRMYTLGTVGAHSGVFARAERSGLYLRIAYAFNNNPGR